MRRLTLQLGTILIADKDGVYADKKYPARRREIKVTAGAGVYIFGRRWGSQFEALYVGKASNIRSRAKGHLNNLRLLLDSRWNFHSLPGEIVEIENQFFNVNTV